jgi:hypothetical protein
LLSNATVVLYDKMTNDSSKALSDGKGSFHFLLNRPTMVMLSVTYIGFDQFIKTYDFTTATGNQEIKDIVLFKILCLNSYTFEHFY